MIKQYSEFAHDVGSSVQYYGAVILNTVLGGEKMPWVRRVEKQINDSYENNPEMEIEKDYKNIPLYSESEVKSAIIDDSEEALNKYIGRQALNGYAGLSTVS